MRKLAFIVLLCSCATACSEDTETPAKWPRAVEARLTNDSWRPCKTLLRAGHAVAEAQCGPRLETSCSDAADHQAALGMLASPACIDRAIEALERFAHNDPAILSDVAAAYYTRAQRDDYAPDLLKALDAAQRAVVADRKNVAAWFNRALAEEAIGLRRQAIASWEQVILEDSEWSGEARSHHDRLRRELDNDAVLVWNRSRKPLLQALDRGDSATIARLIAPFPRAALYFFEEELLPEDHAHLNVYAQVLSARLGNDPYVLELAAAASRNREGHRIFREARRLATFRTKDAAKTYAEASRLLKAGESPLYLEAELGRAVYEGAMNAVPPVEKEARRRNSRYLLALAHATRGYLHQTVSSYLESATDYEAAKVLYEQLDDRENLGSVYRSNASNYLEMGHPDLALRNAVQAQRYLTNVVELRFRHGINGETARAMVAHDVPHVALTYQNLQIRDIRKMLNDAAGQDERHNLNRHLATALRALANIELSMENVDAAEVHLREANQAVKNAAGDLKDKRRLAALLDEVKGRALVRFDPAGAAAAFRHALTMIEPDELLTFRASLLSQEANALRLAGREAGAGRVLEEALAELRKEERRLLETREPGEDDDVWIRYFDRFRETQNALIDHMAGAGDERKAFVESEHSRARELLDLVQKDVEPAGRETIQQSLERGTFLLQYAVTARRTYVWILSADAVRLLRLDVPEDDVKRWRDALQRAARTRDNQAFNRHSYAPYEKLIAEPLEAIRKLPGGDQPRLVISPDVPMQGFPFAALRDRPTGRYLVEHAIIELTPSATLYALARNRTGTPPHPDALSALLVGNPAFDPTLAVTRGMPSLSGAEREVQGIREVYTPHVDVLTGSDATIARSLALARDKNVVHIAAHAIVNPREPSYSMLLLAKSAEDSGVLPARDLLEVKLPKTRLVVLSACSSAGGFPVGAQGVAPLVRPLIAAGVPAVVGSLWDVEDATVEDFFVSFHHDYRRTGDAAAALRTAQLSLLGTDPDLRSLLVWSAFQAIGH